MMAVVVGTCGLLVGIKRSLGALLLRRRYATTMKDARAADASATRPPPAGAGLHTESTGPASDDVTHRHAIIDATPQKPT